jgi:solute:Na+ symporter, SSS family
VTESLRWLDLVVILVYLVAMILVGVRFARRQTSTEAYFVAKRSIPHWAMGISIYAALISSITFVAYPGSAYAGNWNELVPGFMVIGVLLLVGLVIIPFFRHAVGMSAYEYFGKRFGYNVRAYSALAFTAGHFSKMGFVIYTLALTITAMTGWNIYAVMLGAGLVTVFYTVIGGLEAVIWTDVIQGFIKCIGIFVCIGFLFYLIPGGPSAAFHLAWQHHKFSLGNFHLDFANKNSVWVMTLYGFFWYLQKYTADQTLVQRYLVAKSDRDALKGVALGALLCVPAWMLFMLIGTLLWAYYQLSGEVLPAYIDKADKIFPHFLATRIPAGLAGLFMASLLSAAMSMLSSDLNCLSVVGVEDYYRKLRPAATDRQRLLVGKLVVAGCGIVAILIAVIIALYSQRVLSFYYRVTSIIAAGLAGLFLLAFLCPRANKQGAYSGIAACLAFTTWATLTSGKEPALDLGRYNFGLHPVMIGVLAHLVLLGVGFAASYLFAAPDAEARRMTLWGWLETRKKAIALEDSAALNEIGGPNGGQEAAGTGGARETGGYYQDTR